MIRGESTNCSCSPPWEDQQAAITRQRPPLLSLVTQLRLARSKSKGGGYGLSLAGVSINPFLPRRDEMAIALECQDANNLSAGQIAECLRISLGAFGCWRRSSSVPYSSAWDWSCCCGHCSLAMLWPILIPALLTRPRRPREEELRSSARLYWSAGAPSRSNQSLLPIKLFSWSPLQQQ